MRVLLHLVRNSVSHDSRVLKETGSIIERYPDRKLTIAGFHNPGDAEHEEIGGRHVERSRLTTRPLPKDLLSQAAKFMEWQYRIKRAYSKDLLQIIHCHDLEPLPIAVRLKKLTGAKLVYDAHELETERGGGNVLRKYLGKLQESRCMPFVDRMITVSPSIREWYQERYPNKPICIVRNIPDPPREGIAPVPLRELLQVPPGVLLFIYLGGLSKGRGIESILDGFSHPDVSHHVLFMGSGPMAEQVKQRASTCQRIHYHTPVPHSDVIAHAAGADVGLSLIEDTCLSHRFCLPNKLFETLLAGLPVLASNLPDQAAIVRDYECGWIVSTGTDQITKFLVDLEADQARKLRIGLMERVSGLSWKNEAKVLLETYSELMSPP